jgi:methyl coenzyme M reductase subunit D
METKEKLEEVKQRLGLNIKSGRIVMEVKDRDWLLETIEQLIAENNFLRKE